MLIAINIFTALALACFVALETRRVLAGLKSLAADMDKVTGKLKQMAVAMEANAEQMGVEARFNEGLNNILNYSLFDAYKAGSEQ